MFLKLKWKSRLLSGGADARQITRDARIKADDALAELVHSGDERETHGRNDQRVLDEILTLFVLDEAGGKGGNGAERELHDFYFSVFIGKQQPSRNLVFL